MGWVDRVRELLKPQVAGRIRLALFKFSVAGSSLQALSVHGKMACRARPLRLTISATPGKRLPHVGEAKGQRN